ncbi:phytanoyl-CoA dioxygenase family protein [Qipengyuania citrea]|uniref:Phytanoyl-CoA dioxygenase family protein n=1 Tax=Qipengyuania citrea TaxID=225971 RepID=A0ABY4U1U1_9SPHN|nr:phytanoyl-CoA dioxygenase family protein [Qipengyuania citrea]USA60078.1 phytanoyl-CoA dioxygenase family protein [Qipengyuania citrea]
MSQSCPASYDPAAIMRAIYGDGVTGLQHAFSSDFADRLRDDILVCFEEARRVSGGVLPRGPKRFYVEVQPERINGFVEIATHPWFVAVCETVLGPDYRIVEVGFDIPFPGATDQPWHRDFPAPEATRTGRRLNSLAFNLTAIDTRPEHGPFEIAPGTQWDELNSCSQGMFPTPDLWPRYVERAEQKLPQRGDISVRSALTIHRGTANGSDDARPVLVVGVDAPDAANAKQHDLQTTAGYLDALPPRVRDHLTYRVVDKPEPVIQRHTIEGLL